MLNINPSNRFHLNCAKHMSYKIFAKLFLLIPKTWHLNRGVKTFYIHHASACFFFQFVKSFGCGGFLCVCLFISAYVTQTLRDTRVNASHATLPETRTRYPEAPAAPATHLAPLISVHGWKIDTLSMDRPQKDAAIMLYVKFISKFSLIREGIQGNLCVQFLFFKAKFWSETMWNG